MTIDYTQPPPPPPPPPTYQNVPPPRGWWSRNWKWVVAIGCLTPLLLMGACVAGIAWLAVGAIRSSEPYTTALDRARTNPEVAERLGTPIEPKWWVTGNVSVDDNSGTASFKIPIRGPKGEGVIDVSASQSGGDNWTYNRMEVETSSGSRINLLEETQSSPPESTDTNPPVD